MPRVTFGPRRGLGSPWFVPLAFAVGRFAHG